MNERFARQIRFEPLGARGQERLVSSSVLLVGIGALGTHLATTLVRAGVGEVWLVDRDVVELDNLQRQVLFDEHDAALGRPKAIAAAEHLKRVASDCLLHPIVEDFRPEVFTALGRHPDLILDGTDNFATRYLLNDLAVQHSIPWIYGGAVGSAGTAMCVLPSRTPCLRCVFPEAPPAGETGTCETRGILAPTVAAVTAFQSAEALKILSGNTAAIAPGVFHVDVWTNDYGMRLTRAEPDPACRACGTNEFPALHAPPHPPTKLCGRDAVQVSPRTRNTLELPRIAEQIAEVASGIEITRHLLRFEVEGCRFSVFPGGRALLFGIDDPERARILYDRYVGAI